MSVVIAAIVSGLCVIGALVLGYVIGSKHNWIIIWDKDTARAYRVNSAMKKAQLFREVKAKISEMEHGADA